MDSCCSCFEPLEGIAALIGNDRMCKGCLINYFDSAMEHELNWPPRWAGKRLDPFDFRYVGFSTDLLRRFAAREKEWDCPQQERVYCNRAATPGSGEPCDRFIGRRKYGKKYMKCESCSWYTCVLCRTSILPEKDGRARKMKVRHHCRTDSSISDNLEDAFAGLEAGRDYQQCPNERCARRVELKEACNHITCVCGTEFCYICGAKAKEGSNHWRPGGCVLYGQPDSGMHESRRLRDRGDDDFGQEGFNDEAFLLQLEMLRGVGMPQGRVEGPFELNGHDHGSHPPAPGTLGGLVQAEHLDGRERRARRGGLLGRIGPFADRNRSGFFVGV